MSHFNKFAITIIANTQHAKIIRNVIALETPSLDADDTVLATKGVGDGVEVGATHAGTVTFQYVMVDQTPFISTFISA